MARCGAGAGGHARGLDQHAPPGVEAIGDDDVGALARHVEEAALAVERDMVHAHGALLEAVRPQGPGDGGESPVGHQAAVGGDRQDGQRVRAIVADGEEALRRIEGEMHRIVAAGRLAIEWRDMAGAAIDGEGIGLAAIAMHRVEVRAGGIDGEERRILQPAEMLDVAERAGAAIDAIDVDAVALAVPFGRGVAADIGEQRAGGAGGAFHPPSVASARGRDNRRVVIPRCAATERRL